MGRHLAVAMCIVAGLLVPASDASASETFLVTDAADAGPGTLRAAILAANGNGNPTEVDRIKFKIGGRGQHTITLASDLPIINQPLVVNGFSERGSRRNTRQVGSNAKLNVRVVGGPHAVFRIQTNDSVVRGIEIAGGFNGFIVLSGDRNRLEGSHVLGGSNMVRVSGGDDNVIGGAHPKRHNLISSGGFPLVISNTTDTTVKGNAIGTTRNGKGDDGNDRGIFISNGASGTIVGGGPKRAANVIAFNGDLSANDGIRVSADAGTGNSILRNSIHSNSGNLGIDIGPEGVTPNDANDADVGPNNLQNHPVLTSARRRPAATVVRGTLDSTPDSVFDLRFYSSPDADASGFGEGKRFLGKLRVRTDGAGDDTFRFRTRKMVRNGHVVTATATNRATGDTSEFSNAQAAT